MLSNPIYTGLIVHNGETYEGKFSSIVSRATFEIVQKILKDRAKPRKSKHSHNFPFVGLLRCGECGAAVTAQYAHGHGGTYRYYRCTKRLGPCSQRYLRENLLAIQLKENLSKVALCPDWTEKMRAQVDIWEKEQTQSSQAFAQNLEVKIKETDEKLDKLVNAFLDGTIEKETYLIKKDELIKLKAELLERRRDFGRKGNNWNEPLREWINLACSAEKLVEHLNKKYSEIPHSGVEPRYKTQGEIPQSGTSSEDFYEIKSLVEKIGTNRRLLDRKAFFDFEKPFDLIPYYKSSYNKEILAKKKSKRHLAFSQESQSLIWSGRWELNP